jgi:hypothetical protein
MFLDEIHLFLGELILVLDVPHVHHLVLSTRPSRTQEPVLAGIIKHPVAILARRYAIIDRINQPRPAKRTNINHIPSKIKQAGTRGHRFPALMIDISAILFTA